MLDVLSSIFFVPNTFVNLCISKPKHFYVSNKIITYYLRNFNNPCCIKWLERCLLDKNIQAESFKIGSVCILKKDANSAKDIISEAGFKILVDKNLIQIEAIKQAVYELVHLQSNQNSIIQKSEYLIDKLGMSYPQISKLFSKYEALTLEKYIIKNKIIKITDLIENEDYTLSEIAYMMDYSSVQHLSNQFKKETGYTFSEYKLLDDKPVMEL